MDLPRPRALCAHGCSGWRPGARVAEAEASAELPRFVKNEFDAFLKCGILAQQARGVLTLGDARAASQQTYQARLK